MELFTDKKANAAPTNEQLAHVEAVIAAMRREDYYLSLWDAVKHTKPLSAHTLDSLLKPFQDFWNMLPESKSIRRVPFFGVCDLAEAYCFDLVHEPDELAHVVDTPD